MPGAVELLALEREGEMTLVESLVRIAFGRPGSAIPDHHSAAAVLALRDRTFELVVLDRMVLDLDREPFLARHQARSACDRPALHHAIKFEPQVIVQSPRSVLLNDE